MPTSLIGNSPSVKRVLYTTKLYPHWRRFATCRTFQNGTASLPFHNPGAAVRFGELHSVSKDRYPRIASSPEHVSCLALTARFGKLSPGESCTDTKVTLYGRVSGMRSSGSGLYFVDIKRDGKRVQTICNRARLSPRILEHNAFKDTLKGLKMGDIIRVHGHPHKTTNGELSVLLDELPEIVTPCLPPFPVGLQDQQTRMRRRHVDFLVNPSTASLIRLRSTIVQFVRQFLLDDSQLEVQTPILAGEAGGATARPFQTVASEFTDRKLTLRIAPELWLKRLAVGGFDRVFEIGPCFRNEGIDLTHNPEFTTCEFYRAFTNIGELMHITEKLLSGLSDHLQALANDGKVSYKPGPFDFAGPFKTIDFVPALETALNRTLPDLRAPDADSTVVKMMRELSIELPAHPNLPNLLDCLAGLYLEPQCYYPTFIVNHPECLSPLAKTFNHPGTSQAVAARAELFVNFTEIANMYEEENSPIEQRKKFTHQLQYRLDTSNVTIDEEYLEALEWGLPPTGGWGAGIERLCMLMTGTERIGDLLPFGSLRNVLGRRSRRIG